MRRCVAVVLGAAAILASARAQDDAEGTIPAPFRPFESLIGAWKGTAVPRANRLKGWAETHTWAWRFRKGLPAGMSVELQGDKTLAKAQLGFAAEDGKYHLDGTDPAGKAVSYIGTFDQSAKALVLDRVGATPEGKERLTIRPNSNRIRYTMRLDRQEPGAPQYQMVIEVGLTKQGEAFASGGAAAELPKCIVTGGAATLSVVYEGTSYPLCCTGCRDEFNENPAKYVRKALLRARGGAENAVKPVSRPSGGDDAFDGLVDEPAEKPMPKSPPRAEPKPPASSAKAASKPAEPAPKTAPKPADKAASLLRQAGELERAGKIAPALVFYRRIVREYARSPQAKAAQERIRALGAK